MVQEISRDIKKLDYAKRHLTTTITGLKRLHMLVTAVDQLEFMAQRREYSEAANLLNAVNQLSSHFEQYTGVPKVDELRKAVSDTRRALKTQVLQDFRDIQVPTVININANIPTGSKTVQQQAAVVAETLRRAFLPGSERTASRTAQRKSQEIERKGSTVRTRILVLHVLQDVTPFPEKHKHLLVFVLVACPVCIPMLVLLKRRQLCVSNVQVGDIQRVEWTYHEDGHHARLYLLGAQVDRGLHWAKSQLVQVVKWVH